MIVTTHNAKPPTVRPPAGTRWTCYGYRPLTGLPKGPDGQLLREWLWKPVGKVAAPPPEPERAQLSPRQRRSALQTDLFGS